MTPAQDYIRQNVIHMIKVLCDDSYMLNPLPASAIHDLRQRVEKQGVEILTPYEALWIADMLAERRAIRALRGLTG